jgi:hypothetical protein
MHQWCGRAKRDSGDMKIAVIVLLALAAAAGIVVSVRVLMRYLTLD